MRVLASVCMAGAILGHFARPDAATEVPGTEFANPERVLIDGYHDHAMEPFLSRDGRILMFNNRNDPPENTDLHWAERVSAVRFSYRGRIEGANSSALDGVPSMDRHGILYFVSLRSYERALSTIHRGQFSGGRVTDVELVGGLSRRQRGLVNFDVEISEDGQDMYAVDGVFRGGALPTAADIFVARRVGNGFERLPNSEQIMANVNTSALEYAPAISASALELFFTRLTGTLFWRRLTILRATRSVAHEPFSRPHPIAAISGFVEAPTLSSDGRSLYYHKKEADGMHRIYRVTRP